MLEPLKDVVIVKIIEKTRESGIIMPDSAEPMFDQGEITAVGPGKLSETGTRIPMDVVVGDKVLFARYAGVKFDLDGETLYRITEGDIIGLIK